VIRYVWLGLGVMAVATIVACGADTTPDDPESLAAPSASIAPGIDAGLLLEEIEMLASDEFGGRAPGSPGHHTNLGAWPRPLYTHIMLIVAQITIISVFISV